MSEREGEMIREGEIHGGASRKLIESKSSRANLLSMLPNRATPFPLSILRPANHDDHLRLPRAAGRNFSVTHSPGTSTSTTPYVRANALNGRENAG